MDLFTDLLWLPRAPSDFGVRCRACAAATSGDAGRQVRELSNFGLDLDQLTLLHRAIAKLQKNGTVIEPLAPLRLAVVSNATISLVTGPLIATAARYGFALELIEAPFGTAAQELLNPNSALLKANPDIVLVALDHRGLPLAANLADPSAAQKSVDASLRLLDTARKNIRANSRAVAVFQTIPRPVEGAFGNYDRVHAGSLQSVIAEFNTGLARQFGSGDVILDVAALAETVGLAAWHDLEIWHHAKIPFAPAYIPLYADHVCRLAAILRGKSRRCLVLDLDNTLWGGVIGDDGLDGIRLGNGDAVGEAFRAVQAMAVSLRERGVVLAVASKNDEARALEPFRSHPEMVLRENHIAVMRANWEDKASNIRAIAETLSLGLESLVFLDDNPAERAIVRKFLPEVAVPELPEDPAYYPRTLWAAGYFDTVTFSNEDIARAEFYQRGGQNATASLSAEDLDGYLRSLDMTISFAPFDSVSRARIAQLINKSNQFNLTTRRYTELDVEQMENAPDCFTLQVRLKDTFGDNGMISVVICRKADAVWEIDTWLMSCRVLKRRVEEAVLQEIVRAARAEGAAVVKGRYIPTAKNGMVREHYRTLGFDLVDEVSSGETVWRLDLTKVAPIDLPMTVTYSAAV